MSYSYPKTKEEYWDIVNTYWVNINDILNRFLTSEQYEIVDRLRQAQNPELALLFNTAWCQAPDKPWLHEIPSWSIFCDLCSEAHVILPDYEEE